MKALVRLLSITVCHSATVYCSGCLRIDMPALLTRMSSRPCAFIVFAIRARHDSSFSTSTGMALALAPAFSICLTASAFLAASRPATTMVAPARAMPSAMPRPMPPLPPVTTATLPVRSKRFIAVPVFIEWNRGDCAAGRPAGQSAPPARALCHRAIDLGFEPVEQAEHGVVGEGQDLGHQHAGHALLRVEPVVGVEQAGPGEAAGAS